VVFQGGPGEVCIFISLVAGGRKAAEPVEKVQPVNFYGFDIEKNP
jgi:hypothetical protein